MLKPPICRMGGKSKLRKTIIAMIPEHTCYVELFFGAGWVYFGKEPSKVEAINDILNKIAFKGFDVSSDPQIKEISFNNTTNTSTSIGCSVKICSSNDVQQKLKEEIETERTYNNYYYEMYRSAIKNKDVVARYMFLYNIILQICNDKQNRVDAFIVDKIGADRSEYKSGPICNKKGEHIKETVFTRLRNEVGHARKGTNADATRVEMNMKVDELSELVRKAIVEKIETNKQN